MFKTLQLRALESRIVPATFVVTSLADSGVGSLRAMLAAADASPGTDTIKFNLPDAAANAENVISLSSGQLASKGDVNIVGPGANKLTINANVTSRVFQFDNLDNATDSPVKISGLSILNGFVPFFNLGGGIYSLESLELKDVSMSGNSASQGGAVFVFYIGGAKTVTIEKSRFERNSAIDYGGAISLASLQSIKISQSTFSGNTLSGSAPGGALYMSLGPAGTDMSLKNCTIVGNSSVNGGGIAAYNQSLLPTAVTNIVGCTIAENRAAGDDGGGALLAGGNVSITKSTIIGNRAVASGGGILVQNFITFKISNSVVSGNQTIDVSAPNQGGGGIRVLGKSAGDLSPVSITGCTITNNSSAGYGGGVFATGGVELSVKSSKFTADSAALRGGGVYVSGDGNSRVNLSVLSSTFSYNSAGEFGGGVYSSGSGVFAMTSSKVFRNVARDGGGGLTLVNTAPTNAVSLKNTKITGNSGSSGGGIFLENCPSFQLIGGSITDNSASFGGGVSINVSTGTIKSNIAGNIAFGSGGGVWKGGSGTLSVQVSKVKENISSLGSNIFGTFTEL